MAPERVRLKATDLQLIPDMIGGSILDHGRYDAPLTAEVVASRDRGNGKKRRRVRSG